MFSLEAYKVAIQTILHTMDNNSIEINSGTVRLSYSGRGMFGQSCLGIVLDSYDFETFKDEFSEDIKDKLKDYKKGEVFELLSELKKSMLHPSRDSMGMSQIEYYTDIKIPEEYLKDLEEVCKSFVYED